jgi:UDP-N-acetylmuramyl pentapeptide synthase
MKLSQLIKGLNIINLSADVTGDVSTLCYAAGKCEESSLFVAISGLKHDGHDFIADAINRGARYIVYEKDIQIPSGVTAIKVTSRDGHWVCWLKIISVTPPPNYVSSESRERTVKRQRHIFWNQYWRKRAANVEFWARLITVTIIKHIPRPIRLRNHMKCKRYSGQCLMRA